MRIIRWGIIGAGNISSTFVKALNGMEHTEFVAVASRDLKKAEEFARTYNSRKFYGSYEELVQDNEIDVVYIGTPHSEHAKHAKLCIENGKGVLCEKAFTQNAKEAKEVIELANKHNVFLMEAMWTKFIPTTKQVKEWIKEERIGKVINIQANFGFNREMPNTHRLLNLNLAGGALLDVGVYPITYAIHLMGELPHTVKAVANIGETGVDIQNNILFQFANGTTASLSSAVKAEVGKNALIIGEKGKIEVPGFWSSKEAFLYDAGGNLVEHFVEDRVLNGYEYEAYEVNQCIRDGLNESPILPLKDTLDILEIMDSIRKEWNVVYGDEVL